MPFVTGVFFWSDGFSRDGGAINNLGHLTVADSVLANKSASFGGAIASVSSVVDVPILALFNTIVSGNTANMTDGGFWNDGLLKFSRVTFADNASSGVQEAGIWNVGDLREHDQS